MPAPLSVVIPTLNAGAGLARTLTSLGDANAGGLLREVLVSDGGSRDATLAVADEAGCRVVTGEAGRGGQLARGAEAARGAWLLFLHADTALEPWWARDASALMARGGAGVFRHAFREEGARREGVWPRAVSLGANLRTRMLRLPYGDQGLLISKAHYARVGGYEPVPLFEDVGLVRRIVAEGGRGALTVMRSRAVTSPARYDRDGYARRVWRNQVLVAAYLRGVAPAELARRYG